MVVGARARRAGFWLADLAKGRPVRRQYEDVRARMSEASVTDDVGDRLERLIEHASSTTSFYAPFKGYAFGDLPVIDSKLVRASRADFESTTYRGERLHEIETSGSTGVPLTLGHDRTKRSRAIADLLYFNERGGYRVGDRLMWLRSWSHFPESRLWRLARNVVPIDKVGMDDAVRADFLRTLRTGRIDAVFGVASTIWSLTRYLEAQGADPADYHLRVVITGAETLPPAIKRRIETAFGCPVVDRYGNEECGVLASSKPGSDSFLLNRASYHFEFLEPERDVPQRAGLPARVVLTDLYASATPLIRYDTGDLAIVDPDGGDEARTLLSVDGRQIDVLYKTGGGIISPGTIARYMAERFDVEQFQIAQEDATAFTLRVVLSDTPYKEKDFADGLAEMLGPDASLTVEFLTAFPNQSGQKFRTVISNYDPEGGSQGDAP